LYITESLSHGRLARNMTPVRLGMRAAKLRSPPRQLQAGARSRTIRLLVRWKALVSRVSVSAAQPITHQVIRELAQHKDAEALDALAQAAPLDDQFSRRTAMEVIGSHRKGRGARSCHHARLR
jgi:hypothetical protein